MAYREREGSFNARDRPLKIAQDKAFWGLCFSNQGTKTKLPIGSFAGMCLSVWSYLGKNTIWACLFLTLPFIWKCSSKTTGSTAVP